MFRPTLFLGLVFVATASSHGDVLGVVNSTAQVIGTLQDRGASAEKRFADASKFNEQLDEAGHRVEEDFDTQQYSEKMKSFAELAHRASQKAKESVSSKNSSVAENLSGEAEAALRSMTKVDYELDAMEKALHDNLQGALDAKLKPELAVADGFSAEASHLQKQAHSMMDPLYSWGDAAEDKADSLNDQTNDALSKVEKPVRTYRREISRHAREVQRAVERKLLSNQDRTATWRKVNRLVRGATYHVYALQSSEQAGILGVQLGSLGGMAALTTTSVAAAAVSALLVSFVMTMRATRRSDYQLLSA